MSSPFAASHLMPTLYIPHGAGPCFFMQWQPEDTWLAMAAFLRALPESLGQQPKAIVMISAHWLASPVQYTSAAAPELIFDYYGFPDATYQLTYPAAGAPELAEHIGRLLSQAGIAHQANAERGFDHGMFIPLKLIFPEAQIPVVQLSLDASLDPAKHLALGQALAPLREQGVLLIGSGMSFHNMRAYGNPAATPVAAQFDQWLSETVAAEPAERYQRLLNWAQAPQARLCHPLHQEEHLLPLLVVAGAAEHGRGQTVFTDQVLEVAISAHRFD